MAGLMAVVLGQVQHLINSTLHGVDKVYFRLASQFCVDGFVKGYSLRDSFSIRSHTHTNRIMCVRRVFTYSQTISD